MSRRARTAAAAGLALAVIAGLAAWLLSGTGDAAPGASGRPAAADGSGAAGRATAEGSAATGGRVAPDREASADPAHADPAVIEGEVAFDTGWPIRGWTVVPAERYEDGFIAALGDGIPDAVETDPGGRFALRFDEPPAERFVAVLRPSRDRRAGLEVVGAEGGALVGTLGPGRHPVVEVPIGARARVLVRDDPGGLWIRPVDAETGESLTGRDHLSVTWREVVGGGVERDGRISVFTDDMDWIPVVSPSTGPDGAEAFVAGVKDFTVTVPGYRPASPEPARLHGRVVVELPPDAEAVRGVLRVPDGTVHVETRLTAADEAARRRPWTGGLPESAGPFALSGLAPGRWRISFHALKDLGPVGESRWASVEFTVPARGGIDLGDVEVDGQSGLRVRLRDVDGSVRTDAQFVTLPLEGVHPLYLLRWYRTERGGVVQARGLPRWILRNSMHAWPTDEDGWTSIDSLEPGRPVLVASARWPGIAQEVTAPADGESRDFEITRGPHTDCRLQFTFGGREPMHLRGLSAGPCLDEGFTNGTAVLAADIPVGRHRVAVSVAFEEDRWETWYAGIDVPDCGKWNTVVDLKPWRMKEGEDR